MTDGILLICLYGPESTGKSTLARHLAAHYHTDYVPEVARELVTSNSFTADDIVRIGRAQTQRVLEKIKTANRFLFCDTDLITTQIYCRHYLGRVPALLFELEREVVYDHYFLFDTDVPWVADGMRDLASDEQRRAMLATFRHELECRGIAYTLVRGNYAERDAFVKAMVDRL
jgi:HTH-type transcriptional repressor of NAD biosynthesis genes